MRQIDMMNAKFEPLSIGETMKLLQSIGASPLKKFGQNFLVDKNIVYKSVDISGAESGDNVVEVGPGLGTLTRALISKECNVFAVEFDIKMVEFLKKYFHDIKNFNLMHGDAVKYPFGQFYSKSDNFKVVSNLPYNISTPWIDAVLDQENLPDSMTLMLQKEAADRLTARHGNKKYSAISIFLSSSYAVKKIFPVSRSSFSPIPKVDSVILHMEKLDDIYIFNSKSKRLMRDIFSQRRKQITSSVKNIFPDALSVIEEILCKHNFPATSRPEELPLDFWVDLDKCFKNF